MRRILREGFQIPRKYFVAMEELNAQDYKPSKNFTCSLCHKKE
jgi:hypothetical protein